MNFLCVILIRLHCYTDKIYYEGRCDVIHDLIRGDYYDKIRGDIEHGQMEIPRFVIKSKDVGVHIEEPRFKDGILMMNQISKYFIQILDFIEELIVYYYGLKAYERSNGNLSLYYRKNFDLASMCYKYVIQHELGDSDLILLIR